MLTVIIYKLCEIRAGFSILNFSRRLHLVLEETLKEAFLTSQFWAK